VSVSRRVRRARTRRRLAAAHGRHRGIEIALRAAHLIGPHAARHGALIAIRPGDRSTELFALDRVTGALVCWGCGDELLRDVVGTSLMNGEVLAEDPDAPVLMFRACTNCQPLAAKAASA
jgi:hypothetical protein